MLNFWTISNLQRLDYSIRKKIVFYAPLTESLDFYGIDPCTYTRAGNSTVDYRGGSRTVGANVPTFNFTGETPNGIYLAAAGTTLTFYSANVLNNANTVIWFENRTPKSTPTQTNPFDAGGNWTGNLSISVSHICKANAVLANSEINAIQAALLDVPVQDIPAPPAPPVSTSGSPITETPSGSRDGSNKTFILSQSPDLGSLEVFWAGLYLKRVASAPDTLEFTAGGIGNRTLTLGSAPESTHDLTATYWTAPV